MADGATARDLIAPLAARLAAAGIEAARARGLAAASAATGRARAALMAGDGEPCGRRGAPSRALARRRRAREPIAYILGEKEFWSLPFRGRPGGPDPAPRDRDRGRGGAGQIPDRAAPLRILDLGTGSRLPAARAAERAAARHGARHRRQRRGAGRGRANALRLGARRPRGACAPATGAGSSAAFDLIVGNPPYIARPSGRSCSPRCATSSRRRACWPGPTASTPIARWRRIVPASSHGRQRRARDRRRPGRAVAASCGARARGRRAPARSRRVERCLVARRPAWRHPRWSTPPGVRRKGALRALARGPPPSGGKCRDRPPAIEGRWLRGPAQGLADRNRPARRQPAGNQVARWSLSGTKRGTCKGDEQ